MSENERLQAVVERAVRRASRKDLPVVPPPASRWDVWKSTATTVAAILGVFVMAWGGYANIITRAEAAGAEKAVDAGAKIDRVALDLAEHKSAEAEAMRRLESKIDAQSERTASDNAALYRAIMYSQRDARLERPVVAKDAGK